jgi:tetratricopeptide (TPR) repeat protein
MGSFAGIYKSFVAALVLGIGISLPVAAQDVDIGELLADLADPATENWQTIERQILKEWEKSGSASMDLLLQRGQKALEAGDLDAAIEHFTALTDHAPDFAEGWNGRATALFRKQMYGPAIGDIGRVLALNPNHFGAMIGLAVILEETGHDKDALEVWRILETINPHRPELKDAIIKLELATEGTTI